MKYIIKIEEHLVRHIVVEAESETEATAKAERLHREAKIVLDAEDFDGVSHITPMGTTYQRPELLRGAKEYD